MLFKLLVTFSRKSIPSLKGTGWGHPLQGGGRGFILSFCNFICMDNLTPILQPMKLVFRFSGFQCHTGRQRGWEVIRISPSEMKINVSKRLLYVHKNMW